MMPAFQRRIPIRGSALPMLAAAGLAAALLAPTHAVAQRNYTDPREMHMLPEYCKYTQVIRDNVPGGNNPAEIDRWTKLMGQTFIHMHHYCFGLMASNRAMFASPTPYDRRHNLGVSITEFDYVIQRAPADFGLLPEILTKKGENLIFLDRGPEGVGQLQRVIDLKPDYWPPYAYISDYYKKTGDLVKARNWVEKGLSVAPNTRALTRRLAELDAGQSKTSRRQPSAQ